MAGSLEVEVLGRELLVLLLDADARLGVLADALLEEVRLALERDELHPVEGVDGVVELGRAEGEEEAVALREMDLPGSVVSTLALYRSASSWLPKTRSPPSA